MKGYTNLEQSKKLIEILPLESADMYWSIDEIPFLAFPVNDIVTDWKYAEENGMLPAWSLAALLNIIPYAIHKSDNEFYRLGIDKGYNDYAVWYTNNGLAVNNLDVTSDNFVDACVEMIIKLHEQKLLQYAR